MKLQPTINFLNARRKVNDLKPFKFNPRQMTDKQAEELTKSIRRFNMAEVPVVNTDNTIIVGHQRIKILQQEGRGGEEIDVRVPEREMTEEEVREYCIRSNANRGEWDPDGLANWYDGYQLNEWGLDTNKWDKDDDINFNDIKSTEDREKEFKQQTITCPHCEKTFEIEV